ncbi:hypothetical protein [Nocardioides sp.]|uniref:hypothetical protein n=1 Tax=Nocardioides sp. TaxID=35761 RepID=UPI002B26FC46|nr:hypothetical protein [Nocardioides sp.]
MSDASAPDWVADPTIAWRIVLTARLTEPLPADVARERLAGLHRDQGWAGRGQVVVVDDVAAARRALGDERVGVVSLGLSSDGTQVVVSAHHSRVDGLGLLTVLSALTGTPITSSARGVGERPDASGPVGTVVRRLAEVAWAPPARVVGPTPATPQPRDVYVERLVPGEHRTAALVSAGVRGVVDHQREHRPRRRTRHVAVAVGVTRDATPWPISDRSALLRLRDVERLDAAGVAEALAHAATARAVQATGSGAGMMRLGLRALAPRLGSTLLVSHLGRVDGAVDALAFHPVTAGGTGLSLGGVTLRGSTCLTLRARGAQWTHDGLEQLLEAVVAHLPEG